MSKNEQYNLLEAFHILLNYKVAYSFLNFLRQKTRERAEGATWKQIYDHIYKEGISKSKGTTEETLAKLAEHKLIEQTANEYRITLKGMWSLEQYENILKGPRMENIPESVQKLMTIHGWSILLPAQREFIEKCFPPKTNLSILAPPSAGKTFMAECCIFEKLKNKNRVIYITPYKALNRQKYELFQQIFEKVLGFRVSRVDGDTPTSSHVLSESDIVVSTYERALGGVLKNEKWPNHASLAIADEITLLNDQERGSNLDLLLTFLKKKMQLITLSSQIGNPHNLQNWLGGEIFEYSQDELVREFIVKQTWNHVALEDRDGSRQLTKRGSSLKLIFEHMNRKPDETVLILVGPRAKAEELSINVSTLLNLPKRNLARKVQVVSDEITPLVKRLSKVLEKGVAFHHAGIKRDVRDFIEDLLNKRIINIVVATATLSHGVDFPIDYVIVFLDTFEFKKKLDDWTLFPGLSKLEYLQYRGRAGRIGKSQRGDVYIVSDRMMTRTIDSIRRNFLAKKLENLTPSTLTEENLDWMVLSISKNKCPVSNKDLVSIIFKFIQELFDFQTLDEKRKQFNYWKKKIENSMERLKKFGFLDVCKKSAKVTDIGLKAAETNMIPHDSLFVIKNIKAIEKRFQKIDPVKYLLIVVCGIGLLRNFDGKRLESFITAYRSYCKAHNKPIPSSDFQLKCQAKAWILKDWIEEKSLSAITADPVFSGIVYDDDVPRLGHYASMEMQKIASLAKAIGLENVRSLAEELSVRLNRGVKSDLVSQDSTVDLFRLNNLGRRRARALYNNGYRTLLDIFSKIFKEGEESFIRSCGLKSDEATYVLADLKRLFQEDVNLKELCKDL